MMESLSITVVMFAVFGAGFWLGRMWERNNK